MRFYKKSMLALALAAVFAMSSLGLTSPMAVQAVPFGQVAQVPGAFWPLSTAFQNAWDSRNSADIVRYGRQVINFWLGDADFEERAAHWGQNVTDYGFIINNIWFTANRTADHYELLDNREGALWALRVAYAFARPYQALIPHIGGNPADMEFAMTQLRNRIAALDASISLFAELLGDAGRTVYFGALHEPPTGLFFGEQPGSPTISDRPSQPSGLTIYVEFETENLRQRVLHDLDLNETMHNLYRGDYSIIQIAWNFLHEGATPPTVPAQRAKIVEAAHFLNELGLPILLRVGGEVDVWTTPADPDEFIAAFRFIANIMREIAPNVAMVYSVNSVSAHDRDWQMYYPGDDYVDWVGISLYTIRYFQGNPATTDVDAAIYRTGRFAYPIGFIRELVEQFGDRKPLLISEGGVSLYNSYNSADLTDWALPRMRQMYAYIPMLFPEVKAIFWFNVYVPGGNQRYDFYKSPRALELYKALTAQENFLARGQSYSPVTFREIGAEPVSMPANRVALLTYAPFFTLDSIEVQYRLNGYWIGQATDIPYRRVFDFSDRPDGQHVLRITVFDNGRVLQEQDFSLTKYGDVVTITMG